MTTANDIFASAGGGGGPTLPESSTPDALARWSGAGGDALKDSVVVVDDSGNIVGVASMSMAGLVLSRDAAGALKLKESGVDTQLRLQRGDDNANGWSGLGVPSNGSQLSFYHSANQAGYVNGGEWNFQYRRLSGWTFSEHEYADGTTLNVVQSGLWTTNRTRTAPVAYTLDQPTGGWTGFVRVENFSVQITPVTGTQILLPGTGLLAVNQAITLDTVGSFIALMRQGNYYLPLAIGGTVSAV